MIGNIYKPPQNISKIIQNKRCSVFLAGSIELDKAEKWQDKVANELIVLGYDVLNPRRDEWEDCKQSIEDPYFYQQVNWELDGIDLCDVVVMYFDPNTKSPISLMELGYIIGKYNSRLHETEDGEANLVVVCPEGFWRKGNVDVMCRRHNILQFDSLNELIEEFKNVAKPS